MLDDLISVVGKSAPLLATVLGSPLAGMAIGLIGNLFGIDPKKTDDLAKAIKNDPEADAKLKKLEYEHQESLLTIQNQGYATEVEDRKNAREREIALHDHVPTLLALGFLAVYSAIQFYCVVNSNTINDIISARFQDILIMIISYYFGSSHHENKPDA